MTSKRTFAAILPSFAILIFVLSAGISIKLLAGQASAEHIEELEHLVSANDPVSIRELVSRDTNLCNSVFYGTRRLLHVAAARGWDEVVDLLLKNGTDINSEGDTFDTSNKRITALSVAIWYNRTNICKRLLEAGANPNQLGPWDGSALHVAFTYHREEMAGWLLDHGANPFLEGGNPNRMTTPFEMAINSSDGKLVPRMIAESRVNPITPKPGGELMRQENLLPLNKQATQFLASRGEAALAAAAARGELEAVEALLRAGVSAKGKTPSGRSLLQTFALSEAAASKQKTFSEKRWLQIRDLLQENGAEYDAFAATALGDVETARRFLTADRNLLHAKDGEGQTLLHWAVRADRLPLISFWLEAGISPAETNLSGQTAMHLAAARGLTDHVTRLLAAQAPTNLRDTNGWTPLDAAIQAKQTETIRLLMTDKKSEAPPGRGIATTIHQAAASGNIVALSALVNETNLNARNELGFTPLQLALQNGHLGAAALLFDKGADVNARDPDGNTALHLVVLKRPSSVLERPSATWLSRFKGDSQKEKYLQYLISKDSESMEWPVPKIAAFLLLTGVDPSATNHVGKSVVQLALDESVMLFDEERAALLTLLGGSSASLDARDTNGDTALHRAARGSGGIDGDKVADLIKAGADVNATNYQGRTPLLVSVEKIWSWGNNPDGGGAFQVLLRAKPDVNAQDKDGMTALHILGASDSIFKKEATQALLDAGADPNLRDKRGRTAIHQLLAIEWPWSQAGECILMLEDKGADPSLPDDEGKTPLHYLASLGSQSPMFFIRNVTNCFSSPKVDFQARDREGNTPLHIAAKTGTSDVFGWLVKRGADLDATNNAGEIPRLLAMRSTSPFNRFKFNSDTDISQAVREGKMDLVAKFLKTSPELLNEPNSLGQTPLRVAVIFRRTNVVEFLAQQGAQWDAVSAVLSGRTQELREILTRNPSAITNTLNTESLLHLAAVTGFISGIEILLSARADLQTTDSWGLSPLGSARLNHRTDAAALLVQHGARENIFDAVYSDDFDNANTLLAGDKSLARLINRVGLNLAEISAGFASEKILKLLLDKGTLVNHAEPRGNYSPLHVAAIFNRGDATDILIRRGAEIESRDKNGLAPLHLAAREDATKAAVALLKHHANLETRAIPTSTDPNPFTPRGMQATGQTPLHLAAIFAQTNVIQWLLKAGANVNAASLGGTTPLDLVDSSIGLRFLSGPASVGYLSPVLLPPSPFPSAGKNDFQSILARRKVAAELLEKAGAKHGQMNQPGTPPLSQPNRSFRQ